MIKHSRNQCLFPHVLWYYYWLSEDKWFPKYSLIRSSRRFDWWRIRYSLILRCWDGSPKPDRRLLQLDPLIQTCHHRRLDPRLDPMNSSPRCVLTLLNDPWSSFDCKSPCLTSSRDPCLTCCRGPCVSSCRGLCVSSCRGPWLTCWRGACLTSFLKSWDRSQAESKRHQLSNNKRMKV